MLYVICLILSLACADAETPPNLAIAVPVQSLPIKTIEIAKPDIRKPPIAKPTFFPPGCPQVPPVEYQQYFVAAAKLYPDVDECFLSKQDWCESRFNRWAESPAGAKGIAQLMPATAAELGVRDPFDPRQSIFGQAKLMQWGYDRWYREGRTKRDLDGLVLMIYNWGFGNVLKSQKRHGWYLLAEALPYSPGETQGYVDCVEKGTRAA